MMRKILRVTLALGLLLFFSSAPVQAISIAFVPASQDVLVGNPVDVELVISGLGNFVPDSLGTFDLDVTFDSAILSFSNVSYGDPILGDQLDLFLLGGLTATTPGAGSVNLFELSFDLPGDLDTLQAGSFTLATLTFDTLTLGTSSLDIAINALGDAFSDPLVADVSSGSVVVTPEPGTWLLMGTGLVGLLGYAWQKRKQTA